MGFDYRLGAEITDSEQVQELFLPFRNGILEFPYASPSESAYSRVAPCYSQRLLKVVRGQYVVVIGKDAKKRRAFNKAPPACPREP